MKTLVVGCDASGKSTILDGIQKEWGDSLGESTSSAEATIFREANYSRTIDAEYIDQREALYLKLSHQALLVTNSIPNVVTSDSSLVTRVSHSVMRSVITEPFADNGSVVSAWQNDERSIDANPVDIFVLTHADTSVIRDRMIQRQQAGDKFEHFWGFNSQVFLEAYQQRWKSIIHDLARTSYSCILLDTGTTSPEECINRYGALRNSLPDS